ncbi:MAG TPA: hypothetical protein VJM31_12745 [Vicinamibacterales bacterium]|nr:hypothetical protein [Vicinamibacterales bacterium]
MASTANTPGRHLRGITDRPDFDLAIWPDLDAGALSPKDLADYMRRRRAVELYFAGESEALIRERCGIGLRQVNRLVRERCMALHPDGRIQGWRGLKKSAHLSTYTRRRAVKPTVEGRGTAGAMSAMLLSYPDLASRFERQVLRAYPEGSLGEAKRPRRALHAWFLKEAGKLGCEVRNEWPFNVASLGYGAIARWVDETLASNPMTAARLLGGPDAVRKMRAGDGVDRPVTRPFQRVEMDAHKLNGRFCVLMSDVDGGWVPKIIHRLWVIVLVEVATRAVLGYLLCLGKEVSAVDVLRALKCALSAWRRPESKFGALAYLDGANLPAGHGEAYVGLCWDELSVDGALAETCRTVEEKHLATVGGRLVHPKDGFSARRTLDDRPFVETFFRTLTTRALNRLSNSTGSKPRDKGGRDPDEIAVVSEFQLPYLEELLAALIANYNATPHSSLGYRSPLQMLDFLSAQGLMPTRRADATSVAALLSFRKLCRVQGGFREGRHPFINFHHARYSGEELNRRHDLVGKWIQVVNHIEDDARVVMASTAEGDLIGILRASPPWHRMPHSLQIRSAIARLVHERKFTIANGGDAITSFVEYVEALPQRKLPVHPTYLAVQRVLADFARGQERDERDLELARTRLAGAAMPSVAPALEGATSSEFTAGECVPKAPPVRERTRPVNAKVLPQLRMARNS